MGKGEAGSRTQLPKVVTCQYLPTYGQIDTSNYPDIIDKQWLTIDIFCHMFALMQFARPRDKTILVGIYLEETAGSTVYTLVPTSHVR